MRAPGYVYQVTDLFILISSFDDVVCLSNSNSLNELSMDGNPFATDMSYKQILLRHLSSLRQLDMKRISVRELYVYFTQITIINARPNM